MPFISQKDQRQRSQEANYQTEAIKPDSSFGDVFGASVGLVIDEEMSISGAMNREGWSKRKHQVEQLIDAGKIDKQKYMKRGLHGQGYKFDYDQAAQDFPEIPTTQMLTEDRNNILRQRREYAQDVIARGSGMAQFLGSMSAYMLDPISIATLPIATATTTTRGLAGIGRAALKAGAIEGVAELGIQSFVYDHKQDIESPYDWKDALTNIATAATGAAILTGAGKGIGDMLQGARRKAEELPVSDEVDMAKESIDRMVETLKDNPYKKEGMSSEELISSEKKWLEELEVKRAEVNKAVKKAEDFIEPEVKIDGKGTAGARERVVLNKLGIADEYDQDLLKFKQRQGEPPVKDVDQDFSGIKIKETVRIKETGKLKEVESDAQTVWRQATKRRKSLDILEKCLNG
jgi:hypothetical protein